ncbi:MAG: glycosyltransferase [Lachnospiraceae bacterium]|nr:glycosyltransferase [Lachnospiraceae bacterium]
MKPEISVIVPVYNTERYLERCVGSLTGQTLEAMEVLLVDDGSTDRSGQMADSFAEKDPRIRVIHKENEGQGIARNEGLKAAQGTFVCFLDSDDYYDKNALFRMVSVMKETGADLLSFGYVIEDGEGKPLMSPHIRERIYEKREDRDEIREEFLMHLFGEKGQDDELAAVSACMSVFRTDLIRDHRIFFPSEREVDSEDNAFSLSCCRYVKKAATIGDVLYHYCRNEDSFTQHYRKDRFRLVKAHYAMLSDHAKEFGFTGDDKLSTEVRQRIARTGWIGLMAVLKQEYRRGSGKDFSGFAKELRNDKTTGAILKELDVSALSLKQKIFYHTLLKERYGLLLLLTGIRAKSRL